MINVIVKSWGLLVVLWSDDRKSGGGERRMAEKIDNTELFLLKTIVFRKEDYHEHGGHKI